MILSHAHKFIFLKTHKTAGTSTELLLSQFCGRSDVITPLHPVDEALRIGRGPQNYAELLTWRAKLAKLRWQIRGLGPYPAFSEHTGAKRIRWVFGEQVWTDYFKFAIERNPWDREVSRYFWNTPPDRRPTFADFINCQTRPHPLNNFNIYSIDGKIAVDRVIRYEHFETELRSVLADLKIPSNADIPRAKSQARGNQRGYREFYTPETRDIIASLYYREIAAFGYTF